MLTEVERTTQTRKRGVPRLMAELAVTALGIALLVCAIGANRRWLDRHVLPSFLLPHDWYIALQTAASVSVGVPGACLVVVVRPRVGAFMLRMPGQGLSIALAAALALAASEPALRL